MAGRYPCYLFKQTRVNLDWSEKKPSASVAIALPSHPGRGSKNSRSASKRALPADSEERFKLSQHANAASVFYRSADRFPRCILWRVLEDWQVLSLSSVDYTRPETNADLEKTIRFSFSEPLQPDSIGFADSADRDLLVIYALTRSGVLYTLTLTPDFLHNPHTKRAVKPSDYCNTYAPSAFTLNSPHFLLPINDRSVAISLRDGSILKLVREKGDASVGTVARYSEKSFTDSSYLGYLKLKMPWVGATTVPYGQGTVYHTTVISATTYQPATPEDPMEVTVPPLLFTVSVDHTLKVWSLERENLLLTRDLLNEPQTSSNKMRTWLDPTPSNLLQIIDRSFNDEHLFYLLSFSSATTGKFKFWVATKQPDRTELHDLVDAYPSYDFEVTPPTGTAPWIISEFKVSPASTTRPQLFNLWVLWKSDTNFRVQNVQFDITNVSKTWDQWATATTDSLHDIPQTSASSATTEDVTDHWMNWIFCPGRFPDTVVESALHIYESNFSVREEKVPKNESIQAMVARVVTCAVRMEKTTVGLPDYAKYRNDLNLQWERFARLCTELDKARGEALSLVSDPIFGFVWTVNVDGITALRECTESEMIKHNYQAHTHSKNIDILSRQASRKLGAALQREQLTDVMLLVGAANELQNSLSEAAYDKCVQRLSEEVTRDPLISVEDRMDKLYEDCLIEEVPEETFQSIEDTFDSINDPDVVFQSVMDSLFFANKSLTSARLTAFGAKVLVGGSQEVIYVNHELLFNLIFLLLHVSLCGEDSRRFHRLSTPPELYQRLLNHFREYEVLQWMARKSASISTTSADEDISRALTDLRMSETTMIRPDKRGSILQLVLPATLGPAPPGPGHPSYVSLSVCIRQFLAGLELSSFGNGVTNVVTALLRADAAGTANEFSRFIPTTSWGSYMKARVHLKNRNYASAATHFHRAAFGMAVADRDLYSAVGVFTTELELEYAVGGGVAKYHLHVARLFEEAASSEYVVEFCKTALIAANEMDISLKSEVLLKQFHAALAVLLFDEAYMALIRIPNKALQRSSVKEFVGVMVKHDEGAKLCSYPWLGLQDEVDQALEFQCQTILDVSSGPPFHKILYAWRIRRGDYRRAASILYERLQKLQTANVGSTDPNSRVITDAYLVLINVLSCVDEDQAYILCNTRADASDGTIGGTTKRPRLESGSSAQKRKVLTLAELKKDYRREADRVGLLLNGGFFV